MTTSATHNGHDTPTERVLLVAVALREKTWKRGFTIGHGPTPRERTVAARHQARLLHEVAQAKQRFGLPATAPVVRGDEAGRAGVWWHRLLPAPGLTNAGVDASSMAVNRRQRRAKRDGLAVRQLLRRLSRDADGAREVWRVGHGPSVEGADQRPRQRDLETLKHERARTTPRLQGLLRSQGIRRTRRRQWPAQLAAWRLWEGSPMPRGLRRRLRRVEAPHEVLRQPLTAWAAERRAVLDSSPDASREQGRPLRQLQGLGIKGAWGLRRAFWGGRACQKRREVGG